MIRVTLQAKTELHGMLTRALDQEPQPVDAVQRGFRLVPATGELGGKASQLSLTLDAPRAGDEILEHEGQSVLIVDPVTSDLLEDLTLDIVETPDGRRLGLLD